MPHKPPIAHLVATLLLFTCAVAGEQPPAVSPPAWDGQMQVHGAFRAMFYEVRTGTVVSLDTLLPGPQLYAVGALTDLAGEITVIDGRVYLAYPEGTDGSRTEQVLRTDAGAALLVAATVPAWKAVFTDRPIRFADLDAEIGRLAAAAGMNLAGRFPFLLEGVFSDLWWHVIDGRRLNGGGSSHQDHLAAAVHVSRQRAPAVLVGFYSPKDQGVFTRKGTKTHVHCVLEQPLATGHVDHVDIPAGTTVKFPAGE